MVATQLAAYSADEASGNVLDLTGNGHVIVPAGVTGRTAAGGGHTFGGALPNSKGLTQSGSENVVNISPFGQTARRTLMFWMKITADVTDGRMYEFVGGGESVWEIMCRVNLIHLQAWNAAGFARASFTRPTDNIFHHYAGTYDETNLKIYLDATLQATTALTAPLRTTATGINILNNTGPAIITDEARLFDDALTAAEISAIMNLQAPALPSVAFSGWGIPL